jgi:hypothetical protein
VKFENIVVLFGMPRSGTTIISRLIANHSRVQAVIEPYQSRRATNYSESDPLKLSQDFALQVREASSLLVKETLTRTENIERLQRLLETSSGAGQRGAYIFVLRSPLEAFLSQVEAVKTFWAKPTNFSETDASIRSFWRIFCRSMECYLTFALRFHHRFIVYDRFKSFPREEIGRAMTLFGYPLEETQMDISAAQPDFGGDPKARRALPEAVSADDHARADAVARISRKFAKLEEFSAMRAMHLYVKEIAVEQPPSLTIITDLALIARRGFL